MISTKSLFIHDLIHHLPPRPAFHSPLTHEKHLSRAAIRILGPNVEPYLNKLKQLTAHEHTKITLEIKKLQTERDKRRNKRSLKTSSAQKMITELRKNAVDIQANDNQAIEHLLEDYYQIAGCKMSYGLWQEGEEILGPHPQLSNYKVHKIIKNKRGLQLVCLIPIEKDGHSAPIICCRGTTSNPHNWVDDMKRNIGFYSVEPSLKEIQDTLHEMTDQYGPAIITGHSLGGAIAQILTTKFFDSRHATTEQSRIKSLYTFASPGAGEDIKQEYLSKQRQHQTLIAPSVHYYYHPNDIVVLAGRGRVPATRKIKVGTYSFLAFLYAPVSTIKNAHSWKHRISQFRREGAFEIVPHKSNSFEKVIRAISEIFRRMVGIIAHRIIMMQIAQKELEKKHAKELHQKLFLQPSFNDI